jgi:hypothetical protein
LKKSVILAAVLAIAGWSVSGAAASTIGVGPFLQGVRGFTALAALVSDDLASNVAAQIASTREFFTHDAVPVCGSGKSECCPVESVLLLADTEVQSRGAMPDLVARRDMR